MVPRRYPRPPLPEEEPTHGEIFDVLEEIKGRLDRIEAELRRR